MDKIIKATKRKTKATDIGHNRVWLRKRLNDLKNNLAIWEEELTKRNMKINTDKTKICKKRNK